MIAVSNLSFGLESGECFALLGVNGAGKSTTFKSLTCEVTPTHGSIKIAGFNISQEFEKARKLIGYCP
jgi:ABC-type multidrug transport system ATPase subunit